jgi:hypothetical protein
MLTKVLKVFGAFAAVALLVLGIFASTQPATVFASPLGSQGGPGGQGGYGQGAGTSASGSGIGTTAPRAGTSLSALSSAEQSALSQAILEEYGALNLYQSVITQFGNVYPFSQIVNAERQHVNALVRQAAKYGVTVPANPGLSSVPTFDTLTAACQAGVAAEIADAELYEVLNPLITQTDILRVFNNLQSASLNSHLPAFQTCQ